MLSTLFLFVLTALFLQSAINISANYIIQSNQIASAYQARTALNMSERLLKDYIIENNNDLPVKAEIASSAGRINIVKSSNNSYEAVITQENGLRYTKEIIIELVEEDAEEITEPLEKDTESQHQDSEILKETSE